MLDRMNRNQKLAVGTAAAVALIAGVATPSAMAASSSVPSSDGTIHGCYDGAGNVRIIDADNGSCLAGETPVSWPSEQSAPTYEDYQVTTKTDTPSRVYGGFGYWYTETVSCPSGYSVVGGGATNANHQVPMTDDGPTSDHTGWTVQYNDLVGDGDYSPGAVTVTAYCLHN